jgi:hypothetical protein
MSSQRARSRYPPLCGPDRGAAGPHSRGRPFALPYPAGLAVHQGGPLFATENISGRVARRGQAASYFVIDGLRPRLGFDDLVERPRFGGGVKA